MASHNGERFLKEALDSIGSQEFEDFELMVLDDGSTDRTAEILPSSKDARLRVLPQSRAGLTRSLIRGLSAARGEYVARQDADDLSLPQRLKKQAAFLDAHPEVALVGSGVTAIAASGQILRDYIYPSEHERLVAELERLLTPLPHTTIFFRRRAVLECGGYRALFEKAKDYDLHLRLVEKHRLASIPEPLCRLRHSMDSFTFAAGEGEQFQFAMLAWISALVRRETGNDPLESPGREQFLGQFKAWYASSSCPRVFRSRQLRRQARLSWSEGRFLESLKVLLAAIQADPRWAAGRFGLLRNGGAAEEATAWARSQMGRRS